MLDRDDTFSIEELPLDEPWDVLSAMPEIRPYVRPARGDEGGGLRSILEHPRALARAWRRTRTRGADRSTGPRSKLNRPIQTQRKPEPIQGGVSC